MKSARIGLVLLVTAGVLACGEDEKKTPVPEADPINLKASQPETSATLENQAAQQIWGAQAGVAWINEEYGGVLVDGGRRPFSFSYVDDAGLAGNVTTNTQAMCADADVHFMLSTFSTGLVRAGVAAAEEPTCGKIYMNISGAADDIAVTGNRTQIQVLSTASNYQTGFLDMLEDATGNADLRIGYLYQNEGFATSVSVATKAYAAGLGHTEAYAGTYANGTGTAVDDEITADITALAAVSPPVDILIGGGRQPDTKQIALQLDAQGFQPLAVSLLTGPAATEFYNDVEPCIGCVHADHPAEGLTAPSQWEPEVPIDEASAVTEGIDWFGPSQAEFLSYFQDAAGAGQAPAFQAAQAFQGVLVLALAIEAADSLDAVDVRAAFDNLIVRTFYGDFEVNDFGIQTRHEMVQVQLQAGVKQIVWPEAAKTEDFVYPSP
jgi:ABC-type branched-subunit amino acid transport system substrate-binding protein